MSVNVVAEVVGGESRVPGTGLCHVAEDGCDSHLLGLRLFHIVFMLMNGSTKDCRTDDSRVFQRDRGLFFMATAKRKNGGLNGLF